MYQMAEIKAMIAAGTDVSGQQFITPVGVYGVVLKDLVNGKHQAELQCIVKDCKNTHIRAISDWHQCGKCLEHANSNKFVQPKDIHQKAADNKARIEESRAYMLTAKDRINSIIEKYKTNIPK